MMVYHKWELSFVFLLIHNPPSLHYHHRLMSHAPLLNPNKFPSGTRPCRVNRAWKSSSGPSSKGSFSFNLEDEVGTNFGDFESTQKQRVWWFYDEDDIDDWTDDDKEDEFWIFKLLRPFGWMLPAIAVSFLLGTTGPNAFLMALAVPLGQTALSLVINKVWEGRSPDQKPRRRTKSKRRPVSGATSKKKADERGEEIKTGRGRGTYQSWVAREKGPYKNAARSTPKFGGWDELGEMSRTDPKMTPTRNTEGQAKRETKGKLSRRGRVRDTPLLLRLIIAIFPFLGSWTKFLF